MSGPAIRSTFDVVPPAHQQCEWTNFEPTRTPVGLVQPGCRRGGSSGHHILRRRESEWGHYPEAAVRPPPVVDVEPGGDDDPRLQDGLELLAEEDLVTHRPVEALDERIVRLFATEDGGQDWHEITAPALGEPVPISPMTGYVVGRSTGDRPALMRTTDGGRSWHDLTPRGLEATAMLGPLRVASAQDLLLAALVNSATGDASKSLVMRSADAGSLDPGQRPRRLSRRTR